jgi:hypothetical protein
MDKQLLGPGAAIYDSAEHDKVDDLIDKFGNLSAGNKQATIAYTMAQWLAFNWTYGCEDDTVIAMRVVSFCDLLRMLVYANRKLDRDEFTAGTRH